MPFSTAEAPLRPSDRVARYVASARSLATESASAGFTVQQVVERAGQSLKSFYRLFDGKDDLLLALLKEDCAVGSQFLGLIIDERQAPPERLRAWVVGLFDLMAAGDQGYVAVLVREYGRLSEERPQQMDEAIAPFIDLLVDELERARASGFVRERDAVLDAQLVFALVLSNIHRLALGRDPRPPTDVAEHVWSFVWHGIGATPNRSER
jgi:AcrR family transcriptional regulator